RLPAWVACDRSLTLAAAQGSMWPLRSRRPSGPRRSPRKRSTALANRTLSPTARAARLTRYAVIMLAAFHAVAAVADARTPRPLPSEVVSKAPGIKPLGRGHHKWWGIAVYDATLWVVGPSWSPSRPHALDVEPSRKVASETLVK